MKVVWLVANVTAVGSPDRAERAIWGAIWGIFWQIQTVFVIGEPFCGVGTSS